MKCKHGIERPSYEKYLALEAEYKELRELIRLELLAASARRMAEQRCAELKQKMHPCYSCYTQP